MGGNRRQRVVVYAENPFHAQTDKFKLFNSLLGAVRFPCGVLQLLTEFATIEKVPCESCENMVELSKICPDGEFDANFVVLVYPPRRSDDLKRFEKLFYCESCQYPFCD